ncbi:Tigger transposable element-derived protein 1-like 130 [Homarus americanus]|uniref:Tigger transposable element-derived protein 1-like 130 n=1 Tax=Homarus americanus TaxID=6706 RepID=A0A8J5JZW7_HOMAM|nr:Tigger transposable element-derived protein 1-like 130 [Homarus americanus]
MYPKKNTQTGRKPVSEDYGGTKSDVTGSHSGMRFTPQERAELEMYLMKKTRGDLSSDVNKMDPMEVKHVLGLMGHKRKMPFGPQSQSMEAYEWRPPPMVTPEEDEEEMNDEQTRSHFNIADAVFLITSAWKEVTVRCLCAAWRPLWPECVLQRDFEGFEELEEEAVVHEIVALGNSMGLEVDDDDVEELVEEHSKELSTEELLELHKEENETLKRSLTSEESGGGGQGGKPHHSSQRSQGCVLLLEQTVQAC